MTDPDKPIVEGTWDYEWAVMRDGVQVMLASTKETAQEWASKHGGTVVRNYPLRQPHP